MSFYIYSIQPLEEGKLAIRRVRPLPMGGLDGLLAQHVPSLEENWNLSSEELLKLAEVEDAASHKVFFDLTPRSDDQLNLLELIVAKGRTVSMVTDVVFHFKVVCAIRQRGESAGAEGEWIVPEWSKRPSRYEALRLEGGTRGGTWAWSEPLQTASATVL